ncbi:MAG TPA: helix-turn-helix domain-containing protein [Mariprofundaceae bacterium]|nr:helix-turn-helix domain-containing protein [Mariprofundaceae bacterium]
MNDLPEKSLPQAGKQDEHILHGEDTGAASQIEDSTSLLLNIGEQLRQAREAQGKKLSDMVRELKLRKVYLEAMENGDWDVLPDEVYAIGFLRQYAAYLKLDLDDDVNKIRNRQYELTRPLTFPDPPVAPSRRWAWIAAAAFLILFLVFNVLNNDTEDNGPSTAPVSVVSPPSEPAPPNVGGEANTPEVNDSDLTGTNTPAEIPANATTTPADEPKSSIDVVTAANNEAVQTTATMHSFRFEAVNDAVWLQVYLPDASGNAMGELRQEVLLNPGYHFTLNEPYNSLWLTTGNAGALQILIDEKLVNEAGSLGDIGTVLRNYQLNVK